MAKRKNISPSLRWTVFSRDAFTCRYCGAQAGQESVELHVDHIICVADGGDNSLDNLVTACQKCNGGKGARSLSSAPTSAEVVRRIEDRATALEQQAQAIQAVLAAQRSIAQLAVNLKCEAYGVERIRMAEREEARIGELCRLYGADQVLEWYRLAVRAQVRPGDAIKYVHGIIRRIREQQEAASA